MNCRCCCHLKHGDTWVAMNSRPFLHLAQVAAFTLPSGCLHRAQRCNALQLRAHTAQIQLPFLQRSDQRVGLCIATALPHVLLATQPG